MQHSNPFDLIQDEENFYQTMPITVFDEWEWNMYDHIKQSYFYKNSRYTSGDNDNKPFRNITRPILNVQYRVEGFDLSDVEIFVDDQEDYHKSFLVRKFHDQWALDNNIDRAIDKSVETYVDTGGVLLKKTKEAVPEVVPWQRIAFVDQTDVEGSAICENRYYTVSELRREADERNWDMDAVEDVIELSDKRRGTGKNQIENDTPDKYIEVYELHGTFPEYFLDGKDGDEHVPQLHVVTFVETEENEKLGIKLFDGKEREDRYKFLARDEIYGRALGLGGAEELFEAQIWLNYDTIRMKEMMDEASKIVWQTADESFKTRNRTENLDNGEILTYKDSPLQQINTQLPNMDVFSASVESWERNARQIGAATEPVLGEQPPSGTPFRLQALVTNQAESLHKYRRQKLIDFWHEVYRDWIIPHIEDELRDGKEFMAELDLEDIQEISERFVKTQRNKIEKEMILNGEVVRREQRVEMEMEIRERFESAGKKRFMKIMEDEFKEDSLDVKISISGRQKDLATVADKLTNVFRQIIQAPQMLQNPQMAKLFNEILESSGLSPIDFAGFTQGQKRVQQPQQGGQLQALQGLGAQQQGQQQNNQRQ